MEEKEAVATPLCGGVTTASFSSGTSGEVETASFSLARAEAREELLSHLARPEAWGPLQSLLTRDEARRKLLAGACAGVGITPFFSRSRTCAATTSFSLVRAEAEGKLHSSLAREAC